DDKAIAAQGELPSLQGQNGLFFCGAWTRYGFHEDGLMSAVAVAKTLGVEIPWDSTTAGYSSPPRDDRQLA
ncbi:MAG: NAD/FAD-binding protein, partial [Alphaproteobacteria bacterium]|nr:NAD/FAD-binding protein [Alphaproteobacteria bacterium]